MKTFLLSTFIIAAELALVVAAGCTVDHTEAPTDECRNTCDDVLEMSHCGQCAGDDFKTCLPDRPLCLGHVADGQPPRDTMTYGCGQVSCAADVGEGVAIYLDDERIGHWTVNAPDFRIFASGVPIPLNGNGGVFAIEHVRTDGETCRNLATMDGASPLPDDNNRATFSWYELKVGEELIVEYDGWLTCDGGYTWSRSFARLLYSISSVVSI